MSKTTPLVVLVVAMFIFMYGTSLIDKGLLTIGSLTIFVAGLMVGSYAIFYHVHSRLNALNQHFQNTFAQTVEMELQRRRAEWIGMTAEELLNDLIHKRAIEIAKKLNTGADDGKSNVFSHTQKQHE